MVTTPPVAVVRVISGSPAATAGPQPGDVRLAVQGRPQQMILADDATFRVSLPAGWQKRGQATLEGFSAVSPQGESFASGMQQVFANRDVLAVNLRAYQLVATPHQLTLLSRLLSPPLRPVEVVTRLFPQIAGGAMRDLRVVYAQPMPAAGGAEMALIHYQYTLLPRQDAAYASLLPPLLLKANRVPMEATAVLFTMPSDGLTWTFIYGIVGAPQPVFARNKAAYPAIFGSFEYIPQGLAMKIRNNAMAQQLATEMNRTTREVAHLWELRLGGLSEYGGRPGDPGPVGTMPDNPPAGCYTWWRCGEQPPFCSNTPPLGYGCRPVPAPR